jgi:pyruvate/2-oxoglutarate dehydrogenase complex dihydrolipoamide dehydrogenase (E3) component
VQDFLHHESAVKDAKRTRVVDNMIQHGLDIFKGTGSFCDKRTIKMEAPGKAPEFLEGDLILIAACFSPRCPDDFPISP